MTEGVVHRWDDTRATLTALLAWLDETRQWVEATGARDTVSQETEAVAGAAAPAPEADVVPPDLYALLAGLTALRQEVKLQTRAARSDREQAAGALTQLTNAVAQFDTLRQEEASRRAAAVQETTRVAIDILVDLHDALSRSARQADRLLATVGATLREWGTAGAVWDQQASGEMPSDGRVEQAPPQASAEEQTTATTRRGFWHWLRQCFRRPAPQPPEGWQPVVPDQPLAEAHASAAAITELRRIRSAALPMADRLEGLAEGLLLNVQRLERALAAYGIEPIACLDTPVDADLMEVVQIVTDPTQPPGVVLEEIRRGYRRHGQVYRFAQVIATRAIPQMPRESLAAAAEDEASAGEN
jgi:molecular chaperone GrpE